MELHATADHMNPNPNVAVSTTHWTKTGWKFLLIQKHFWNASPEWPRTEIPSKCALCCYIEVTVIERVNHSWSSGIGSEQQTGEHELSMSHWPISLCPQWMHIMVHRHSIVHTVCRQHVPWPSQNRSTFGRAYIHKWLDTFTFDFMVSNEYRLLCHFMCAP